MSGPVRSFFGSQLVGSEMEDVVVAKLEVAVRAHVLAYNAYLLGRPWSSGASRRPPARRGGRGEVEEGNLSGKRARHSCRETEQSLGPNEAKLQAEVPAGEERRDRISSGTGDTGYAAAASWRASSRAAERRASA